MSETTGKASISASPLKSPTDAEAGESAGNRTRFKSKFNDAEYDRWRKALDAKRARKGAS